jgi:hypothetical protein
VTDEKPKQKIEAAKTIKPAETVFSDPWSGIEVGRVVLWSVDKKEGWFEAKVVALSADRKQLHLKWRDYPTSEVMVVNRNHVGLLSRIT